MNTCKAHGGLSVQDMNGIKVVMIFFFFFGPLLLFL